MNKVHEIDGIAIYEPESHSGGFYVDPLDLQRMKMMTLPKIKEWCRVHRRAYAAKNTFCQLSYRFNEQCMEKEDLIIIAHVFAGTYIAKRALEEQQRLEDGYGENLSPTMRHKREKIKGYIYLLAGLPGTYKIGRTANLESRLGNFAVKLPFKVKVVCIIPTEDTVTLEKELHQKYQACRLEGEWFQLNDEEVRQIIEISSPLHVG